MDVDLAFVWAWIVAFAVLAYVLLDGFDLGLGILFPLFPARADRTLMMNSVAPVWDGNETWLVLGGGSLLAAFPLAYAVLMPAFYAPLIAMLLGLVFRGVCFEFRDRTEHGRRFWEVGFAAGSIVGALCQGLMLGAFVQGVAVAGRAYAGGWFDWLTPFTLLTGVAVAAGYALLGCCWLIMKTEGAIQDRCFRYAKPLLSAVLGTIVAVSLSTPLVDAAYAERWFSWPNITYVAPVPLLVALLAWAFYRAVARRHERAPFLLAEGLFVLCFAGFGISVYPYIVPRAITVQQAAAPDSSLIFLLVGVALLMPLVLAYTAHAYWVFRGKTRPDDGYH